MEDREIIELFWRRDQAAIDETDSKYGANCLGLALRILSSREDAEECVSDTYMAAWNSIPPGRPEYLSAWLYRVVRNLSFDRVKERYAQKRGGGEAALIYDELEPCLASDFSVERELEARELAEEISRFLLSLSRDDRLIFAQRYWLMLPTSEVAKLLCFKENKVRTSLHRSRKKLREYLTREGLI